MSNITTTNRLKELLPQLFDTQKPAGNCYLRFGLTDKISGLIAIEHVRESICIPSDRITAVPNLAEYVVGLTSSQNEVFLTLDLAHLAGLPPETVNLRQYQTIVVKIDLLGNEARSDRNSLFGLAVKKIQGIERILPNRFVPIIDNLPPRLLPFIKGAVPQRTENTPSTIQEQYLFLIDIKQLIYDRTRA